MQRRFTFDTPVILTVLTVLGMLLAVAALWPLTGVVADRSSLAGLCLVYLAGGLPAAWRALETLWKEQILDIDLLMVVAAVAAAAVAWGVGLGGGGGGGGLTGSGLGGSTGLGGGGTTGGCTAGCACGGVTTCMKRSRSRSMRPPLPPVPPPPPPAGPGPPAPCFPT